MVELGFGQILMLMGVPSALTGFFFWLVEHNIQKREAKEESKRAERQKKQDEKDLLNEKNIEYLLKAVDATLELCEATARAVQRIPDAKCNGDMHSALSRTDELKKERMNYLNEQMAHLAS